MQQLEQMWLQVERRAQARHSIGAAAEQRQVGSHLCEAPKILDRRNLCGGINDQRDAVALGEGKGQGADLDPGAEGAGGVSALFF